MISNFAGPNATGFIPPDPTVATGPSQVVAVVNTTLAIYDKSTGSQLFSQNMNGATGFFASVGATTTVFDPWALYDFETQRFFVIAVDIAGSTSNIFVAVSKTSTPTGANDWHKYKIDFTHTPSGATAALGSGAHFLTIPRLGSVTTRCGSRATTLPFQADQDVRGTDCNRQDAIAERRRGYESL